MKTRRLACLAAVFGLFACTGTELIAVRENATLKDHVQFMTTVTPARDWSHPERLLEVADYIAREFEAAGGRVQRQEFEAEGKRYQNVRALFGPETGARLIVGAHYDVADELSGADDNASGTAVLLELAERMSTAKLKQPVEMVAWTLEEPPFFRTDQMGSAVHARALEAEEVELDGLINLEMVGFFTDEPDSQRYPIEGMSALYPKVGNYIAVVGRPEDADLVNLVHGVMSEASDLPATKLLAPASMTGVDFSDHLNFWERGYTALMITDTSFYRNDNYHTAGDTADTLDYRRMGDVEEGVWQAILEIAGEH